MALLEVKDLTVRYGGVVALHRLSLQVEAGEIVTLLGANGAGKSTTLRAISGLVPPAGGQIRLDGEEVTRLPAHALVERGVAHVPEGRKVFPTLTVEENLNLGGYTRRRHRHALAEGRDRVYQLFPRLKERRHQLAGTLSGGEQQMLAIGRGLMASPRLLLLDEPSLGLAPKLVVEIFRTIKAINRQGVAVLLVEQNARLALHVAQRGYVLETGRLVLEGMAHELQGDPQVREAYLGGRV
ncbi:MULTISPECIES: ABC transporter ATP-binding protein [Limnochorda]|jgi:branched-chain amino acid transport system ATP-binding protein|uniref:ABC transporter ATP-binding protein n=1 Tax=Limnochorda TaxID=1676651 RepID=UPI001D295C09|nr:ABC transporter ATP-binding protein [Limnochorda pilosa]MBO2487000.1 ABC transporter ATP-binding protein [Bacillota bacterium]